MSGFGHLPAPVRVAVVVVGAIVAVNLTARVLVPPAGSVAQGGRSGSAYATVPEGLAAYADLLHRNGYPVERRRGPLQDGHLDPRSTLLVIEPAAVAPEDEAAMARFVGDGGRLVIGGRSPGRFLDGLGSEPPRWDSEAPLDWTSVDPSLAPITEVVASGDGAWIDPGGSRPLLAAHEGGVALLTVAEVGSGEILYLADAAPLENRGLAAADNAAMALALAGEGARPVVFAEGVHGYGASGGWRAIPDTWKLALGGLAAAALLLMWARGHRLGPPEQVSRPFPPARREHVVALAAAIARTRSHAETAVPLQGAVRRRLATRFGLAPDASNDDFDRAGVAAGMDEEERRAALESVKTLQDLLAAGRALARLSAPYGGERR